MKIGDILAMLENCKSNSTDENHGSIDLKELITKLMDEYDHSYDGSYDEIAKIAVKDGELEPEDVFTGTVLQEAIGEGGI